MQVSSKVCLNPIVAAAQAEISLMFRERETSKLFYHSLEHTREVVEAADQLASILGFSENDHEAILLAAWWHDAGMLTCGDDPEGHEAKSELQAKQFLLKHDYPKERIALVCELILATDMNHIPKGVLQQAMRDADMSGLGRPEYRDRLKSLHKEWNAQGRLHTNDRIQWLEENIAFFKNHTYLTPAAERLYGEQKSLNLERLKRQLKKRLKKKSEHKTKLASTDIREICSDDAQNNLAQQYRSNGNSRRQSQYHVEHQCNYFDSGYSINCNLYPYLQLPHHPGWGTTLNITSFDHICNLSDTSSKNKRIYRSIKNWIWKN